GGSYLSRYNGLGPGTEANKPCWPTHASFESFGVTGKVDAGGHTGTVRWVGQFRYEPTAIPECAQLAEQYPRQAVVTKRFFVAGSTVVLCDVVNFGGTQCAKPASSTVAILTKQ